MLPHFKFERQCFKRGLACVAGVDEVGRGPLAGPVYAAAVVLDPARLKPLRGLNDSKRLAPAKREKFAQLIAEHALAFAHGEASREEIDRVNILQATFLAMRRALAALPQKPDAVLVDGNQIPDKEHPWQALVGGDGISLSIAAASVLAKVRRDALMRDLHARYPNYHFDQNKGYATPAHLKALAQYGPCPEHRFSFLNQPVLPFEERGDEF